MKLRKRKSNDAKLSSPNEKPIRKTITKRRKRRVAKEDVILRLQKRAEQAISNNEYLGELGLSPMHLDGDDSSDEIINLTTVKKSKRPESSNLLMTPTVYRKQVVEKTNEDTFPLLADELMLSIFKWLSKSTLVNCARVCKHWRRLALDESLWQRIDLGNHTIQSGVMERVLCRGVKALRLSVSTFYPPAFNCLPQSSQLEYLDLSNANIDVISVEQILERCLKLKKLSLESCCINDKICSLIAANLNLTALNLSSCEGLTKCGFCSILRGCSELTDLNVADTKLNHSALLSAANCLTINIKRLNFSGFRFDLTDDVVTIITERCYQIEELDISDSSRITTDLLNSLKNLTKLHSLALSRCYNLKEIHDLYCLKNVPSLRNLVIFGLFLESSVQKLQLNLPNVLINGCLISTIARPTTGVQRTSLWGIRMHA